VNGRLPAPLLPAFIQAQLPAGVERYRAQAGDYAMHVLEAGEGPPVLMLHGNPTWGFLYRKVFAELAGDRFHLVAPDLVGLGYSDRPRASREHTLENHARWFGALLDALALERPVVVMQDWGGPVALRALADRPGLASGLVVLNTVVGPPRPGFKPSLFHRLATIPVVSDFLFRILGVPQVALHLAQGDKRSIRGDVARAYRAPLRGLARNAAPLALARMVPGSPDHPSTEPLRRCQEFVTSFAGPIAVVWGDRDPVLGRVIGWIQKLLPRARVARTAAGHFLQEEVPREIADAVRWVAGEAGAGARA
jgi:haloalkane dehalogenase